MFLLLLSNIMHAAYIHSTEAYIAACFLLFYHSFETPNRFWLQLKRLVLLKNFSVAFLRHTDPTLEFMLCFLLYFGMQKKKTLGSLADVLVSSGNLHLSLLINHFAR